ncbi:MAG TPA: hypothetical protein PKK64_12495 [Saprospiraceae bacterium]|nr:hypothetical protein [Saprospiraceae bacterium]HMX89350.1 hypothetical protein [Saprospiraceae bacterium]HMZ41315.1 hypothetical protein [Saprospiraceae bacterium]HNB31864.1 hypothetical protein [Saprospiraceae bacterium]HNC37601.1 hypothetical protein [Saprospiraceae bacterium]
MEIPGLGYFTGTETGAAIDPIKKHIQPSRLHVQFDHRAHQKTEEMVENIHTETGFAQEDLEQALARLVMHLGSELRVRKEVLFEPFGKLFYAKENNVLQFHPTDQNLHMRFFGLESIPLLSHSEPIVATTTPIETFKTTPPESMINRRLLWLLGLLWLLFLSLLLCPSNKKKNTAPPTDKVAINDSTVNTPTPMRMDSTHADSTIRNEETTSAEVPSKTENDTPGKFTHEEKVEDHNMADLNEKIIRKECVIIVGSFLRLNNAERLSKKIEKQHYKLFREKFGEFNRVGIAFDCAHENLQTMLEKLRKQYAPDSWILKY